MKLSEELEWRGMVKDRTFDDLTWLDTPRTFYLGADVGSADSLTVGNLSVYVMARIMAEHGWKTVLLVGGATSLIGDPGGKDEERDLKSKEEVEHNVAGIRGQVERLFTGKEFETVNNYDWFKDIGYLDFLREVGKHYSMTELVQREYITARMGESGAGISYAEFSYSLIQGYDYWWLFKNKGVELQLGGSDQWGNMLSGVPLIRKKEGKEVHAVSMPLIINKATGKKFGKSEAGAVWLDAARTDPVTEFYQFWLNSEDDVAEEFLKRYTMLDKQKIEQVMGDFDKDRSSRIAQKTLAYEVTKMVHGEETANKAVEYADNLMKAPATGSTDQAPLEAAPGDSVVDLLVNSGLTPSKGQARRLLESGGIYINGEKTSKTNVDEGDFVDGKLVLRRGKTLQNTKVFVKR